LEITNIRIDGGTQPRANLDAFTIDEYADHMASGDIFPPITVFFDGAEYWLADGFHRVEAYKQLGLAHVDADVRQGTLRDAVLFSVSANSKHGKRRTNADKRRAVLTLLEDHQWQKWSDHEIARQCKVSQPFVSNLRSSNNDYKIERKATRGGTTYTINTRKIGKTKPSVTQKIVPEVREQVRGLPLAEDKKQIAQLAKLPEDKQRAVVDLIVSGTAPTVGKAIRQNRQTNRVEHIATIPPDVFNVIYADPAWEYGVKNLNGTVNNHYGTMAIDDICNLPVNEGLQIAENAVLFLWVTNPFLVKALQVVEAWGFEYKTNIVWVKTELVKPGAGFYVRGRHELLYICTRGTMTPLVDVSPPIGSVLEAPIQEHSRKPDAVYTTIERLYPDCNYIELFARRKREGWAVWGNQIADA
jgi:N6-adenosine-specific RNA methylase IME4